jgi:hypothetical protein
MLKYNFSLFVLTIFLIANFCFPAQAQEYDLTASVTVIPQEGTMFSRFIEIYDADGDRIKIWGSGELWNSEGLPFQNRDSLGDINLESVNLIMRNFGGGDGSFNLHGQIISSQNVGVVKLLRGDVESNSAGVDVKRNLRVLYVGGKISGEFNVKAENLNLINVGGVEGSLNVDVENLLKGIRSRGRFKGRLEADRINYVRAVGDLSGVLIDAGYIRLVSSFTGRITEMESNSNIGVVYAKNGIFNSEISGNVVLLRTPKDIENLKIGGSLRVGIANNIRGLEVYGDVLRLIGRTKISDSLIGSGNSKINYVYSPAIEHSTFYGSKINRFVAFNVDLVNVIAENEVKRVFVRRNANNLNVLAGLNLGEDRQYGTADDRWRDSGKINFVRIGQASDTVISVAYSLDDEWGNGDERVIGESSLRRVIFGGIVGNVYAGSGSRFYVRAPYFRGWVEGRKELSSNIIFEVVPIAE